MNTEQKSRALYLCKVSQGAQQHTHIHTQRLFLACHGPVWHRPESLSGPQYISTTLDLDRARVLHFSEPLAEDSGYMFVCLVRAFTDWAMLSLYYGIVCVRWYLQLAAH